MIELSMNMWSTDEKGHSVTCTAKFANMSDAIKFHDGLARLAREHSGSKDSPSWTNRLLLPAR